MADSTPFVTLRLEGPRFDGPGMPVEALAELVSYRELLMEVAKGVFYQNHPERQRLPRGFSDRLQLRLSRVDAGSAVPVLERISTDDQPAMIPSEDEFTEGRRLIVAAISAVSSQDDLPSAFPSDAVGYFNRFGRTLQAGEAIVLGRQGSDGEIRYTPSVRRTLLLSRAAQYRSNREVIGRIVQIDAEASIFTLRSEDRATITCHYEWELFSLIKEALHPDGAGPAVVVEGEAVLDDRDRIKRMVAAEVTFVEDADETGTGGVSARSEPQDAATARLLRRLNEIGSLEDGWLDGQGYAPDPRAIERLSSMAVDLTAEGMPAMRIYPTPEGGIQMEWRSGTVERSIEIKADGGVYAVDVDTLNGEAKEWEDKLLHPQALLRTIRRGVGA